MMQSVVEILRDRDYSAFFHQYSDGRIANGFVTNMTSTLMVDPAEVERLIPLTHLYDVTRIAGTPVIQVRRRA